MFVTELENLPILHVKDGATEVPATALCLSPFLKESSEWFSIHCINANGPLLDLLADPEFFKDAFLTICATHNIQFKPRLAPLHNTLGVAESPHETIRLFIQKLFKERKFAIRNSLTVHHDQETVARPTFLKNALLGSKFVSSFELARGYRPQLTGLD